MRTVHPNCCGLTTTPAGQQAIAAIAAHALQRQQEQQTGGAQEPLLSWESIMEFQEFRITVRCEYSLEDRIALARLE